MDSTTRPYDSDGMAVNGVPYYPKDGKGVASNPDYQSRPYTVQAPAMSSVSLGAPPSYVSTSPTYPPPNTMNASSTKSGSEKSSWTINTAFGPIGPKTFFRKDWIKYYIILIAIGVLTVLMTVYHDEIVTWMKPFGDKLRDLPAGWLIPVGVLFVISFPPLFGHEIVAVLCGVVWPFWEAFGIVALGTLFGEWGNFFVFKWLCTGRAKKYEQNNINYECMARVMREGGFKLILLARLSAIPGHLTTPVFATIGMSFWIFTISAVLTLPKQMLPVYLGSVFEQQSRSTSSKIVEDLILVSAFALTIFAAWYIYRELARVRPQVMEERRLAQERSDAPPRIPTFDMTFAPTSPTRYKAREGGEATTPLTAPGSAAPIAGYGMAYGDPYDSSHGAYGGSDGSFEESRLPYSNPNPNFGGSRERLSAEDTRSIGSDDGAPVKTTAMDLPYVQPDSRGQMGPFYGDSLRPPGPPV